MYVCIHVRTDVLQLHVSIETQTAAKQYNKHIYKWHSKVNKPYQPKLRKPDVKLDFNHRHKTRSRHWTTPPWSAWNARCMMRDHLATALGHPRPLFIRRHGNTAAAARPKLRGVTVFHFVLCFCFGYFDLSFKIKQMLTFNQTMSAIQTVPKLLIQKYIFPPPKIPSMRWV